MAESKKAPLIAASEAVKESDSGHKDTTLNGNSQQLEAFEQYRITDKTEIPPIEVVASINGEIVAVNDELTSISGAEKAGKSAIQTQFISEILSDECTDNIRGLVVAKADGEAVIHVDSEQARSKQQHTVKTILRKGNLHTCPDNFLSYNFRHLDIEQMMPTLTGIIEAAQNRFDAIHSIWVDGIADFIQDSNDLQTSIEIVRNFMHIAAKYHCPVFCIIHTNPGGNKERGHLGSELLRKSGSVLTVTQDEREVSTLTAKRLRYGGKGKIGECLFKYDSEKGYHVGIEVDGIGSEQVDARAAKKMKQVESMAKQIFSGNALSREDAIKKIMVKRACQDRTASGDFALMTANNLIKKSNMDLYTLNNDEDEPLPY
jgi:hypothetical protein